mmetsp:Transcript_35296/g.6371  ORF Transcript_35296/g.6371 Transcript_35296/m.6371 type:complete len:115 (-) Transcript_35296:403-747(-)
MNGVRPLQSGEKFDLSLSILDRTQSRDKIKIGVIYVKDNQTEQKEILANDTCSKQFLQFVSNLGEPMNVATHEGYLGGLDPSGTVGTHSIYYSDWEYEVAFHVVPFMPTDHKDE